MRGIKRSFRAAAASAACSMAAVLVGYDMYMIGSIIATQEFIKQFGVYHDSLETWTLPANRQLVWTVCQFVAAIFGAIIVGQISDMIGRRMCFIVTIVLTLIGTTIEVVSPNWGVWALAKIIFGLAMGFMQGNTQAYVSEVAPIHIRGFMLSLFQLWIVLGAFLATCVLEGTSKVTGSWSWKAAIVSQYGIGAFCLLIFFFLATESPYWLLIKGRHEAAQNVLLRLRGKEPGFAVNTEMAIINATIQHEQEESSSKVSYLECFKGADLRRTLIACLPMVMQQFCGFPLCGNYLAYFLKLSGLDNAFMITLISTLLSLAAVLLSFALIENVGRRPQLLAGTLGMTPCLLAVTVLGWVARGTTANGQALAAFSIMWCVFYYISLGAIGWTIVGEVSSSRLRAKTTAIATAVNALCNLVWSIAIPYLINEEDANLGPKAGVVFLGPAVGLTIVAFFAVPETKGKSFAELDRLFELRTPTRKF
ncbi:general substrate transporter [Aspergillus pseudoustus]|uniref:General substrate transporter n=1 Tax=Aspergillus pseudoustus TaxID=1810923 RepID=A0ABR4JRC7_9EURO